MKSFLNCHIVEVGSRYKEFAVFKLIHQPSLSDKSRKINTWCVSLPEDGLQPKL